MQGSPGFLLWCCMYTTKTRGRKAKRKTINIKLLMPEKNFTYVMGSVCVKPESLLRLGSLRMRLLSYEALVLRWKLYERYKTTIRRVVRILLLNICLYKSSLNF